MKKQTSMNNCPHCHTKPSLVHELEHGGWDCHGVECSCGFSVDTREIDTRRSYDQDLYPEQSAEEAIETWNDGCKIELLRIAAPELLQALEDAIDLMNRHYASEYSSDDLEEIDKFKSVVAKAEGKIK